MSKYVRTVDTAGWFSYRWPSKGRQAADLVACPKCGAPKGYHCLGLKYPQRNVPHPERFAVARAKAALLGKPLKRTRAIPCPTCRASAGKDCNIGILPHLKRLRAYAFKQVLLGKLTPRSIK